MTRILELLYMWEKLEERFPQYRVELHANNRQDSVIKVFANPIKVIKILVPGHPEGFNDPQDYTLQEWIVDPLLDNLILVSECHGPMHLVLERAIAEISN